MKRLTSKCSQASGKPCIVRQQGVAAVEFALVLVILLVIVAAIIEFGRIFWYDTALTKATRDGARQMALSQSFADLEDVRALVVAEANAARIAQEGTTQILTDENVLLECLNGTFGIVACSDDDPPAHVRVSIIDFNVTIGSWMPLINAEEGYPSVSLSPQTTMSYMP